MAKVAKLVKEEREWGPGIRRECSMLLGRGGCPPFSRNILGLLTGHLAWSQCFFALETFLGTLPPPPSGTTIMCGDANVLHHKYER